MIRWKLPVQDASIWSSGAGETIPQWSCVQRHQSEFDIFDTRAVLYFTAVEGWME